MTYQPAPLNGKILDAYETAHVSKSDNRRWWRLYWAEERKAHRKGLGVAEALIALGMPCPPSPDQIEDEDDPTGAASGSD